MDVELVVARFQEDISWTTRFNGRVIVYNKGNHISADVDVRPLPNVGREAHTYLHHILENWDSLADVTIFTQGDPIEHSPDFYNLMQMKFNDTQPLSYQYLASKNIPPQSLLSNNRQYWVDDNRVYVEFMNRNLLPVLPEPFFDHGLWMRIIPIFLRNTPEARSTSIVEHLWQRFGLGESAPVLLPFCYAALFSVPRSVITRHSLSTYREMYNWTLEHNINGYVAERLWLSLFGYHERSDALRYDAQLFPTDYEKSFLNILKVCAHCNTSRLTPFNGSIYQRLLRRVRNLCYSLFALLKLWIRTRLFQSRRASRGRRKSMKNEIK